MSIRDSFQVGQCNIRLRLSDDTSYDDSVLLAWLDSDLLASWQEFARGGSVGLCIRDNALLALALLALDGIAESIVLFPAEAPSHHLQNLKSKLILSHWISNVDIPPPNGALAMTPPPFPASGLSISSRTKGVNYPTRWVIPTSGTTRFPKFVSHTFETLSRTVKRNSSKGRTLAWGLLYDLNRFAGLQVFLQAMLGGSCLLIPDTDASLETILAQFQRQGCNSISATPTLWRKLLMTPGIESLDPVQITLGGEIADRAVLYSLATVYPRARVVHIYASTEAGVGFSVTDGREGFPLSYLNDGIPGADLRISKDGILEIRPLVSGQQYLSEDNPLSATDGFISTGDMVRIQGDRIFFLGRESGSINVGGNKVQPEEIEAVLLDHPDITFARVTAKPSAIMGSLVEAHVVLRPGNLMASEATNIIRDWCSRNLEKYKIPAIIRVVNHLETSKSGKLLRND